jgi:hypothetical protein
MPLFDFVAEITVEGKDRQAAADNLAHELYVLRRPLKVAVYRKQDGPDAMPYGMTVLPPGTLVSVLGKPLGDWKLKVQR